jgi:hypothetical protein
MTLKSAAVLFLCGWSLAAEPLKPLATIPLRLNNGTQSWIEARLNGSEPMSCNLDSGGGDRIYLDRERAARMGIEATASGFSAGPQSKTMTLDGRARVTLEAGGLKFADQQILLQSRPYADFACVIGQTVFQRYVVEVDYETPAVRLYDPGRFSYGGPGKTLAFTLDDGNPFLPTVLTTPAGKPVPARLSIDTGCGLGLAILSKRFVDANNLMSEIRDAVPERRYGMEGQQAKVVSAQFGKLVVGPFEISQPQINLWQVKGFGGSAGPDGLLCGDFLRRFRLFFDYPNQKIVLEPSAR